MGIVENTKPIKRHEALIHFSRDHHFGLLLTWKIRQGLKKNVATERISNYILFFYENDLKKHFADEEKHLFSQLSPVDALYIQVMKEHEDIYRLIASIEKNPASTTVPSDFADTLEKHIRFEERVLFNHMQNIFTAEKLETILSLHTHHHCNVDDRWNDHFWSESK